MNCIECQDNLVAFLEDALDAQEASGCQAHLAACPDCRRERDAIAHLQQRLAARGRAAASVSLVAQVMGRIRDAQNKRNTLMHTIKPFLGWGLGLGAAGLAIAALLLALPKGQLLASEVLTRGVQAARQLAAVHIKGRVRTAPGENFAHIDPKMDFVPVELWKEFKPQSSGTPARWRVEKPGRVAVMDGQSTLLYLRSDNAARKVPRPSAAAFDTGWLHELADIDGTLERELRLAKAQGLAMAVTRTSDAAGARKTVVTVAAKSGLPDGDYLKNKFFSTADTRRVYRFDEPSGKLEGVQVYLQTPSGETLVLEVDQIDYNQLYDLPTFQVELPANVGWIEDPKPQPDDARYAAMTPEQAARAFFEACGRQDWIEVAKFWPMPLDDRVKGYLGGLQIVKLGDAFTSAASPGKFVPYEIRLPDGSVKQHNLSLKQNPKTGRWMVDGGL